MIGPTLLLLCLFACVASADVRRYAATTEIRNVSFDEDRLSSVLDAIWAVVKNEHREAPELIIDYATPADAEKVISLRIRELSAYRALELAGRKAGFRVTISPAALVLSPGPDRARSKAILSEQLALRNLLTSAVSQGDLEALCSEELISFYEKQITGAQVFRAGANARGEPPIEFYALAAIKLTVMTNERAAELFTTSSPAGRLYLIALFSDLKQAIPLAPIPFVPEDGLLYQTASPSDIIEAYILSGEIAEKVAALLPKSAAP